MWYMAKNLKIGNALTKLKCVCYTGASFTPEYFVQRKKLIIRNRLQNSFNEKYREHNSQRSAFVQLKKTCFEPYTLLGK